MPVVTINDYSTLPPRNPRPFSRQCPNMRTCWPGLSETFNPMVSSRPLMFRRCAFLVTLFFYFLHVVLTTWFRNLVGYGIPTLILRILFLFFVAWNLHIIVDMVGNRTVMERAYAREDFDKALGAFAIASGVWVACDIWQGGLAGIPEFFLWGCLDLAILGVAWVATWDADDAELSLP